MTREHEPAWKYCKITQDEKSVTCNLCNVKVLLGRTDNLTISLFKRHMQRQHPSLWKQLYCSGDNTNFMRDSITPRIVRQRDPAWKHCKVHPEDEGPAFANFGNFNFFGQNWHLLELKLKLLALKRISNLVLCKLLFPDRYIQH